MYTTIMSFALEKSNKFNRHVFKKLNCIKGP